MIKRYWFSTTKIHFCFKPRIVLLLINRTTPRTMPFLFELLSAITATIAVNDKRGMHLFHKNPDESGKEDVTDIYLRGQYKKEIAEDAARCQP